MKVIISFFIVILLLKATLVNADQVGKKPKNPKMKDPPYTGNVTLFMRSGDNVYTFKVSGRKIKLQRPILNLRERYKNNGQKEGGKPGKREVLNEEELNELKKLLQTPHAIYDRQFDVIYPGTKWCGAGNEATSYDDLGTAEDVDMCCREHDQCDLHLEAGEIGYGLENTGSYTRVSCHCERIFYDCLSNAQENSFDAAIIGFIYFDVLDSPCIRKKQICTGYSWWGTTCTSWEESNEYEFVSNGLSYIW